jgi:aspartate aminotransferase-like enzyme
MNKAFPYTPATNLLFGLREAAAMLREEGWRMCFSGTTATARRRARRSRMVWNFREDPRAYWMP